MAIAAAAILLAGCSSFGSDSGASSGEPTGARRILNTLAFGDPNAPPAPGPREREILCPRVEQRSGAAAYRVYDRGRTGDNAAVRYQASFTEFTRECATLGMEAGFRVGVAGQVVVGPAGTPGSYDVPVLITLLDQDGQTVITRRVRIQATASGADGNATFRHVEDLGSLPKEDGRFAGYRFQVGFEQPGSEPHPRR